MRKIIEKLWTHTVKLISRKIWEAEKFLHFFTVVEIGSKMVIICKWDILHDIPIPSNSWVKWNAMFLLNT